MKAILGSAEVLLTERGFDAISVDDLARGAGISRPTFYFYFASKEAVLLALLDRVIAEANERVAALPRDFSTDPVGCWRQAIQTFVDVFAAHRGVTIAAARMRTSSVDVGELWSQTQQQWVAQVAAVIEAEQGRGAALSHINPRNISIALNSLNERVLPATFSSEEPAIPEEDVAEVLLGIWLTSIYGTVTPNAA